MTSFAKQQIYKKIIYVSFGDTCKGVPKTGQVTYNKSVKAVSNDAAVTGKSAYYARKRRVKQRNYGIASVQNTLYIYSVLRSNTTECAEIASPSPVAPRPSSVVALTFTRSGSHSNKRARLSRISLIYGASFGF